ncbi:sugar ABC transporter substrate-binding protein [Nocardioides sp. LHG3406-4]|uniref:sugar ABC transporter substrate-binding protein n=1 Tax=Nocardioides sp. LHG3406-4 TaxID=2804575 RepID=UPI003CF545B5
MLRRGRSTAAVSVALVAVLVSACSSADEAGVQGGDASELVAEMQSVLDQASGEPEFKAPGPELDASQLSGKTVAIIGIDLRVPAIAEVAESAQDVAEQAGLETTVFDAQGNASMVRQGLSQAIDGKVGAILSVGLVVDLIHEQIVEAKDAGIPMVDVINTPPDADAPGQGSDPDMFGNVAPDSAAVGRLLAATAIVQTDGDADVAIMNTSELTVAPTIVGAMHDTLDECEACEYSDTDTALVDWSTELPNQASSVLRSDPNVNFMLPIYDAMTLFASTGVRQAGGTGKVQMASFNGTAPALELVADGDIATANVAQNNDWAAWAAIDQAMRGMLDLDPADPVLPVRYVTTDDLDGVDTSSQSAVNEALFGTGYRQGYLELWGLA